MTEGESAPETRPIAVFDLDHTILHMMSKENMPEESAAEVSEDVLAFEHQDVDYCIALRVGTTSLFTALRKKGVDIAVATCNLLGEEILAALAARCDAFKDVPVHVITSRDKGAKSLEGLGLKRPRAVIFDDSLNAWVPADHDNVFVADRFDVVALDAALGQDDDAGDALVDREGGYMTSIREQLLAWVDPPTIEFDDFAEEPGTPRETPRSSSFAQAYAESPARSDAGSDAGSVSGRGTKRTADGGAPGGKKKKLSTMDANSVPSIPSIDTQGSVERPPVPTEA
mmetsp:Transcript_7562/g.22426  ORF Transcript_7562/g.22426 Transcript_7562/m.22426 type:complete len:285 (+) Transcript_7562:187-1041(+)|eukprot:CAMPEP_0119266942 /NCGR_PEP_ID=MMETSP1329-20130426/5260_1 /TAXON_ID=114041 /ORGANISM="Genus nov. species nov., Strain RCC1024" /LENGTH=284 /DNA_ID=CAMNT_0007266847 /DNA_START=219 /DNA_END=1073 /DNA_ORIENTATION=+